MHIGQSIGTRQAQTVGQYLTLRQTLALSLEQIVTLVHELRLAQVLTMDQVIRLVQSLRLAEERHNAYAVARAIIRECGAEHAAFVLDMIAAAERMKFQGADAAQDVKIALRLLLAQRKKPRVMIALRQMLRAPEFFGGKGGTASDLYDLLLVLDQFDADGNIRWVLGGGWAVELLTGVKRPHHDIDAVLVGPKPAQIDTDAVTPRDYFGVISCSRRHLIASCLDIVEWRYAQEEFRVIVLKPEYLFCSKFVRRPRPQDWKDVVSLVVAFAKEWDVAFIERLARHNACGFTRKNGRELRRILDSREPAKIIPALRAFWEESRK